MKPKQRNNIIIGAVVILIIAAVGICGYFAFSYLIQEVLPDLIKKLCINPY